MGINVTTYDTTYDITITTQQQHLGKLVAFKDIPQRRGMG